MKTCPTTRRKSSEHKCVNDLAVDRGAEVGPYAVVDPVVAMGADVEADGNQD